MVHGRCKLGWSHFGSNVKSGNGNVPYGNSAELSKGAVDIMLLITFTVQE